MSKLENYKPYPEDVTKIHIDGNALPRFVASPANMTDDGTIFLGIRHFCPLMNRAIDDYADAHGRSKKTITIGMKQGFVDQHGTFMDRKEAYKVAVARCQIRRSIGYDTTTLYSEHLH